MKAHRITLADDDPDVLFLLHKLVEKMYPQSSISMFSNAEDAYIHILDRGTDLLITDHGMGMMSGAELVGELRREQYEMPILMISSNPQIAIEAQAAGATAFVEKSLDLKSLEQAIRTLLPQ